MNTPMVMNNVLSVMSGKSFFNGTKVLIFFSKTGLLSYKNKDSHPRRNQTFFFTIVNISQNSREHFTGQLFSGFQNKNWQARRFNSKH
jgi:hypothetical protein